MFLWTPLQSGSESVGRIMSRNYGMRFQGSKQDKFRAKFRTSKQDKFRVEEHRKNITQRQTSLIYQHINQEHHDLNWKNVLILNKHQNTYSEKFLEACHTQVTTQSFNRSITSPTTYTTITHNTWKFCPILYHFWSVLSNIRILFTILTKIYQK